MAHSARAGASLSRGKEMKKRVDKSKGKWYILIGRSNRAQADGAGQCHGARLDFVTEDYLWDTGGYPSCRPQTWRLCHASE